MTGNPHKVDEVASFFSGIAQIEQVDCEIPELRHDDVRSVARAKAETAWDQLRRPLIVDDTGFFVPALNGFPGTCAAYCMKTIGNGGILKLLDREADRSAYFETAIAYASPEGIEVFTGRIDGIITGAPRGLGGFGYDPIFLFDSRTLAELPLSEKSAVSHRGKALALFRDWFVSRGD